MSFLLMIVSSLFLSAQSMAQEPDQGFVRQISMNPEWGKLLHFKSQRSGFKSALRAPEMFLAKDGRTNLENELLQNIKALKTDPNYPCVFPARASWIAKQMHIDLTKCAAVENWKSKINAESVAWVHVSQYVSNPSSAFGHSFFLFRNHLRPLNLDMVYSNAAEMPEDVSAWDYATKGIFGGFPGTYTVEPFYIRIQEYNNMENRDMWIYDLNLSKSEVDLLLEHLWELTKQGSEPYYFTNQNCAVNIFDAVAAVKSSVEFVPSKQIYVIPIEGLQLTKDLVVKKTFLPSLRKKIILMKKHLRDSKNAAIDQAEIDLEMFEFKKSQNAGQLSDEEAKQYFDILVRRSKLGLNSDPPTFDEPRTPDAALPTWKWGAGWKKQQDQNLVLYSGSFFNHSMIEPFDGYLPNSEIVVISADFTEDQGKRFNLDKATFVSMTSLPTSTDFDRVKAFRIFIGTDHKDDCEKCFFPLVEAAVGKSFEMGQDNVAYALIGGREEQEQILLPEVAVGFVQHFGKINLNAEFLRLQDVSAHALSENRGSLALGVMLFSQGDLQLKSTSGRLGQQYSALLGFYF